MRNVKDGDEYKIDVYYVKEYTHKDVISDNGIVNKIPVVKARLLYNPNPEYLKKPNVEVISHRVIKIQVLEINKVGGRVVEPRYLVGLRIIDGNEVTPTFHIMVKDDIEFKEKVTKELEYYLKIKGLLD